jgi:uracil-DNA glycosylase
MDMDVLIEQSWKKALSKEFEQPYFIEIANFLKEEKKSGKIIYPSGKNIFRAFDLTPIENTKVVILGQDPYHNPGQAHGLCFSVLPPTPPPPSLKNIFKELESDLGIPIPNHGNLDNWASQGVLLLNATLTVEANQPNSHSNIGWQQFTDAVISCVSTTLNHTVFILWGSYAQSKISLIDSSKHCILKAPHPSPLSAHRGFLGCKHFSKCNQYLLQHNKKEIDWDIKTI